MHTCLIWCSLVQMFNEFWIAEYWLFFLVFMIYDFFLIYVFIEQDINDNGIQPIWRTMTWHWIRQARYWLQSSHRSEFTQISWQRSRFTTSCAVQLSVQNYRFLYAIIGPRRQKQRPRGFAGGIQGAKGHSCGTRILGQILVDLPTWKEETSISS